MESEILKLALSQGLWAVLFVVLLFYVLKQNAKREESYQNAIKDNAKREENYQDIIKQLTETLKEIPGIKEALQAIKKHLKID